MAPDNGRLENWEKMADLLIVKTGGTHYMPSDYELLVYQNKIDEYLDRNRNIEAPRMLVLGSTPHLVALGLENRFVVTCVDFSKGMIALNKSILESKAGKADFIEGDWRQLSDLLALNTFDVVIGDASLNNVEYSSWVTVLGQIGLVLKKDGLLILKEIVWTLGDITPGEADKKKLAEVLGLYQSGGIGFSDLYVAIRFGCFSQGYDSQRREYSGAAVFNAIVESRGESLKSLAEADYNKILSFKNPAVHTLVPEGEVCEALASRFKRVMRYSIPGKGNFKIVIAQNVTSDKNRDLLFDLKPEHQESREAYDEYREKKNTNFLRAIREKYFALGFVQLAWVDWELRGFADKHKGEWDQSQLELAISDQEKWLSYLATLAVYNRLEHGAKITDYIYLPTDKKKEVFKVRAEKGGGKRIEVVLEQEISPDKNRGENGWRTTLLKIVIPTSIFNESNGKCFHDLVNYLKNTQPSSKSYYAWLREKHENDLAEMFKGNRSLLFDDIAMKWPKEWADSLPPENAKHLKDLEDNCNTYIQGQIADMPVDVGGCVDDISLKDLLRAVMKTLLFGLGEGAHEITNVDYVAIPSFQKDKAEQAFGGLMVLYNRSGCKGECYSFHQLVNETAKYCHKSVIWKMYSKVVSEFKQASRQSAKAAIMARNMSHNIGSHVLSGFIPTEENKEESRVLNHYLQKRMDLIAGLTSGWEGAPEDMWFHSEVVMGFLRNTALLDFIVQTYGYTHGNIVFEVNDAKYLYDDTLKEFRTDAKVKDFLVSIPNGVIGAQAVYVIFENIIRNAAKYGKTRDILSVAINCKPSADGDAYLIELSENLSRSKSKSVDGAEIDNVSDINHAIAGEIIQSSGEPITEKLGMAEIRIAAEYLSGSERARFSFKLKNEDGVEVNRGIQVKGRPVDGEDGLAYEFYLQAPKNLLMVVRKSEMVSVSPPAELGIKVSSNLEDLTKPEANHKIAYVHSTDKQPEEFVDWLKNNHWRLPYRVIIAKNLIEKKRLFPENRFCLLQDTITLPENTNGDGTAAYKDLVLGLYREWIKLKWKEDVSDIHLLLGFNNEYGNWTTINHGNLHLFQTNATPAIIHGDENVLRNVSKSSSQYLVYDRHGEIAGFLKSINSNVVPRNVSFHHPFGKTSSAQKLGDTFDKPPQDTFLIGLFFLALVETAFTRVLIVDERAVEGLVMTNMQGRKVLRRDEKICFENFAKQKIGVPFGLKTASMSTPCLVSKAAGFTEGNPLLDLGREWKYNDSGEGFDIIVFHQGTIDQITSSGSSNWFEGAFALAPYFVVTSGRGKYIRHLKGYEDLPFIQISAIKENLIDEISKYHLVKSVTAAKGG